MTAADDAVLINFLDSQRHWCQDVAVLAATPLSTPAAGRHDGDGVGAVSDLRFIVLHMIEETAQHLGHLDAAREPLDGRTGLGQGDL